MVVYRMAFNARNIFLSETAPVIYDGNKTTDYYWTNFSNRKISDVLLSNPSVWNKRYGFSEV